MKTTKEPCSHLELNGVTLDTLKLNSLELVERRKLLENISNENHEASFVTIIYDTPKKSNPP